MNAKKAKALRKANPTWREDRYKATRTPRGVLIFLNPSCGKAAYKAAKEAS